MGCVPHPGAGERALAAPRPEVRGPSGGVWGGRGCVRRAGSSLPGGPSPLFSPQLLPQPRRRPSPGCTAAGPQPRGWKPPALGSAPTEPRQQNRPHPLINLPVGPTARGATEGGRSELGARPPPSPGGLVSAEVGSAARRGCQLSPQPARGRRIPMTTRTPHPPASQRAEPPAKPHCRRGRCPHGARVGSCRPAPMRGARSWGPRRPGGAPRASSLGGRPRAGGAAPPGLAASP